jgi:hypothetical protein
MEVGTKFNDIESYNKNMSKHLEDKLFWYDRFGIYDFLLVDFGCADGALINQCCDLDSEKICRRSYVGYDISETMIDFAKTSFRGSNDNDVFFTSSWDDVKRKVDKYNGLKILLLSSVIHEVYSYAKEPEEIDEFWDRVLNSGFDYIIVRDMMVSYDTLRPTMIGRRKDYYDNFKKKLKGTKYEGMLEDFEAKWGSCNVEKNFIHFLLKSNWLVNWNRELNENYFPIYVEEFLELMNSSCATLGETGYNLDYLERFQVPYLYLQIHTNLHEQLTDNTHIKCIFSKKK